MKKFLMMLGAFLLVSGVMAGDLFAYNYINSSSFVRMPARAATISTPDAMYYNPAGLVKLEDGFYTEIGNTFILKTYSHNFLGITYADKTPVLFDMNGGLLYKNGKGALFVCNYVPEGGGMSDYKNKYGIQTVTADDYIAASLSQAGLGALAPTYVHAYKFWVQIALGGAYSLTDWLALTSGIFANIYYYDVTVGFMWAGSVMDLTTRANGWSGWAGFMLTPHKAINFTAKYAIESICKGKITDKKYHYSRITEARLPAYMLLGLNIKPADWVEIQANYQLSFTEQKDYATSNAYPREAAYAAPLYGGNPLMGVVSGGNTVGYKNKLTHAFGLGAEFKVHERLLVSAGIGYENAWLHPRAQNPLDPKLASISVGAGFRAKATDMMSVDIGVLKNTYFKDKMQYGMISMRKDLWVFSIDLSTKWM
jgi:long-subunit fatty acid transport protein